MKVAIPCHKTWWLVFIMFLYVYMSRYTFVLGMMVSNKYLPLVPVYYILPWFPCFFTWFSAQSYSELVLSFKWGFY